MEHNNFGDALHSSLSWCTNCAQKRKELPFASPQRVEVYYREAGIPARKGNQSLLSELGAMRKKCNHLRLNAAQLT